MGERFTDGKQNTGIGILFPTLGTGIKEAHCIQLVSKEFHTDRFFTGRGEYVQNAAPNGKLAHTFHHAAAAVPGGYQLGNQVIDFVFSSGFQGDHCMGKNSRGERSLACGFPGQNLDRGITAAQSVKLAQTLLFPGPGYDCSIIQCQIPAGKYGNLVA